MITLIERVFRVPRLGCPVIYGVSDNDAKWWDNSSVAFLGWRPKDNAERTPPGRDEPDALYQGGHFCTDGIHEE
jgi:uronate dehydrogenase